MEYEKQNQIIEYSQNKNVPKKNYIIPASILIFVIIFAGVGVYMMGLRVANQQEKEVSVNSEDSGLEEKVLPIKGVVLPAIWGDLGVKLTLAGGIDAQRFKTIYNDRGEFTEEYKNLLFGKSDSKLKMTMENAGYLLNLFWALGLTNKNPILDSGEMVDPVYGGAQNFASTAGWTVAKDNPMNHYSRHSFFNLTNEQQVVVDKVSRGIYRSCCDNSTHFPDCNHGMAMLGLLEWMASQGVSEQEMWATALAVNSYWFPDTYISIATYMKNRGVDWKDVDPREVLGINYSSISGYKKILNEITASTENRGGGCSV